MRLAVEAGPAQWRKLGNTPKTKRAPRAAIRAVFGSALDHIPGVRGRAKRDMTFIEAAAEVLRQAGKPLHYKEITELAIGKNLLSHVGKTPEVTMSHRLTAAIKKDDKEVPIVKVKPGVFALREWEEKRGRKSSPSSSDERKLDDGATADDASVEVNALEIEAALRGAQARVDAESAERDRDSEARGEKGDDDQTTDDRNTPVSGDDARRADLAASGADLFDDEDDDDQPILAPPSQPGAAQQPGGVAGATDGGRRRRRRRRRGRGGGQGDVAGAGFGGGAAPNESRLSGSRSNDASQPRVEGAIQPAAAAATATGSMDGESAGDGREPFASPRPVVRDRHQIMAGGQPTGIEIPLGEGDELAGRELADAAAIVLSSFDRGAGPVPLRTVADALMRRGRLQGDPGLATAQASASMRADNLRRSANGQRPRFRFASGSRVALTDWTLGGELPRLEQDVIAAIERYREASRRALLRRLQELPGHALIELVLLSLECVGMTNVRAIRRPGSPGGESHFAALHKTGGDAIPTAIVVRKDGREVGRERVTDLRGALHHYGPASAGWLVTAGQVLSGAREEATAPGAAPVALYDGIALCKLLDEIDVAVIKTRFSVAIPDLELLEALRG